MTSNKEPFDNEIDKEDSDLELYRDEGITSLDAPVPLWLKCNYVFWVIFGLIWLFMFWNGSTVSFFDRGYWHELQEAANTTLSSSSDLK